jgi:hypothetical protein
MRRLLILGFVVGALASCGAEDLEIDTPFPQTALGGTGGSGGSGGGVQTMPGTGGGTAVDPNSGTGMPCDVATALGHSCTTCHGTTLKNMAPMQMVTRHDLLVDSATYPTQTIAERALARMNDNVTPMPPTDFGPRASGTDRTALSNWITAGFPSGTCLTTDEPTQTGTGGGTTTQAGTGGGTAASGGGSGGSSASGGGTTSASGGGSSSSGGGSSSSGGGSSSGSGGGTSASGGQCDDPALACQDVDGQGDFECLSTTTSTGFPSGSMTCYSPDDCDIGWSCVAASATATHGKCLQDCYGN